MHDTLQQPSCHDTGTLCVYLLPPQALLGTWYELELPDGRNPCKGVALGRMGIGTVAHTSPIKDTAAVALTNSLD